MRYKVSFKWNLTGLNSGYSFSQTGCYAMVKETSLPYYLPITGRKLVGFIPFLEVLTIWNTNSSVQDLNWLPFPFLMMIIITPKGQLTRENVKKIFNNIFLHYTHTHTYILYIKWCELYKPHVNDMPRHEK